MPKALKLWKTPLKTCYVAIIALGGMYFADFQIKYMETCPLGLTRTIVPETVEHSNFYFVDDEVHLTASLRPGGVYSV